MKHIFKILRISSVYLAIVSLAHSSDSSALLDSISATLYQESGILINATIEQKQLESSWSDDVTIEIVDSTKFIIIATEQLIKVDADTIFTWIPSTHQVIIDYYFPDEFNLLSLLSGNLNQVIVDDIQKRTNDAIINFTIPQIGSWGKIWMNTKTYHPARILLEDELDNHITVKISSVKPLGSQSKFPNFVKEQWEVIDLR